MGQPISHSTNSGFNRWREVRALGEDDSPASSCLWAWWERSSVLRFPADGLTPSEAIGVAHCRASRPR